MFYSIVISSYCAVNYSNYSMMLKLNLIIISCEQSSEPRGIVLLNCVT
jgi:hypothetical protein